MQLQGADCVVTPAHFAKMQLDIFQKEAKKLYGSKDTILLHMSQLVGLALGISPAEMGMPKRHLTITFAAVTKL